MHTKDLVSRFRKAYPNLNYLSDTEIVSHFKKIESEYKRINKFLIKKVPSLKET